MPSIAETGKCSRMMSLTRRFCCVYEMPKSPRSMLPMIDEVLLEHGPIEPVTCLEVGADLGVDHALARQRIAGHGVHRDERRRRDEPDGDDSLREPLQSVDEHVGYGSSSM